MFPSIFLTQVRMISESLRCLTTTIRSTQIVLGALCSQTTHQNLVQCGERVKYRCCLNFCLGKCCMTPFSYSIASRWPATKSFSLVLKLSRVGCDSQVQCASNQQHAWHKHIHTQLGTGWNTISIRCLTFQGCVIHKFVKCICNWNIHAAQSTEGH